MSNTQIFSPAFGRGSPVAGRTWKNSESEIQSIVDKVVDLPVALRGCPQWTGSREVFAAVGGIAGSLSTINGKGQAGAAAGLVAAVYFGSESRQNILNGISDASMRAAVAAAIDATPQNRVDGRLAPLTRDSLLTAVKVWAGTVAALATIKAPDVQIKVDHVDHVDRSGDSPAADKAAKRAARSIYDLAGTINVDADGEVDAAAANDAVDAANRDAVERRIKADAAAAQHVETLVNNAIAIKGHVADIAARFIADHGAETAAALAAALTAALDAAADAAKPRKVAAKPRKVAAKPRKAA